MAESTVDSKADMVCFNIKIIADVFGLRKRGKNDTVKEERMNVYVAVIEGWTELWNKLHTEVVQSPLEVFKTHLHSFLCKPTLWSLL